MQMPMPAIAVLTLFGLGIASAAAQGEPMGTIEGTIDGEPVVWRTLDVPEEGTATAEVRSAGPVTMVSIQGHREGESIMRHILSLEFSVMNGEAMGPVVSYFPEGMSNFYVDEHPDAGTDISVARLELDGNGGIAEGSFRARLCLKEGMMSDVDIGDCRMIEGVFETELRATE